MKKVIVTISVVALFVLGAMLGETWNTAPGQFSAAVSVAAGTSMNDTMTLAGVNAGQNVFTLDRNGAAGDTVKAIVGTTNLKNGLYLFMVDTDDSSVTFIDGQNLHINAAFTLDKTDDKWLTYFDGTNFYTVGTPVSNE